MKYHKNSLDHNSMAVEKGSVRKKWKGKLSIALVFPNYYRLGMSNLGFQLIYGMLNAYDGIVCERVFLNSDSKPLSVESNRPLTDFSIVLFSLSFEQDFPNIISIMDSAGIEPMAESRLNDYKIEKGNPLIVAGGVATFINPEPVAPFFDLMVLGEAEAVLPSLLSVLFEKNNLLGKKSLLQYIAASCASCYVPWLYKAQYFEDGLFSSFLTEEEYPKRIKKAVYDGGDIAGHSEILSPQAEFSNIFLAELGRGCSRGCRFCAAGYVYRPPRLWAADVIVEAIKKRPNESNRVGLLGMEMAQIEDLEKVAEYLLKEECALSFSSLRADIINPTILELLSKSRLKSAAIAPDGPSERLRKVISKNINQDDIINASTSLVRAGVKNLKLYFMIGLPTETLDDLDEMISLVKLVHAEISEIGRARGYLSELVLSVNSFVPKAWTPFQFFGFVPVSELKKRVKYLRKGLAGVKNLKISFDNPDRAYFQATLARGDRKVANALVALSRSGKNWRQVFKENGVDPQFYAHRERQYSEQFPWEIVDHGLSKQYLWHEYEQARESKPSNGCLINRELKCRLCGVCNDRPEKSGI